MHLQIATCNLLLTNHGLRLASCEIRGTSGKWQDEDDWPPNESNSNSAQREVGKKTVTEECYHTLALKHLHSADCVLALGVRKCI